VEIHTHSLTFDLNFSPALSKGNAKDKTCTHENKLVSLIEREQRLLNYTSRGAARRSRRTDIKLVKLSIRKSCSQLCGDSYPQFDSLI